VRFDGELEECREHQLITEPNPPRRLSDEQETCSVDILSLVLASIGGVTGVSGLVVSIRADRRATKAEAASTRARQRELWSELIAAMQDVVGASVLHQNMRPPLVRIRSARTELVDGVSNDHYKRLGRWMEVDHLVLATLFEKAMWQLDGSGHTLEQIEEAHRQANEWAAASINNLRLMRKSEPSAEIEREIDELIEAGQKAISVLAGT
jgi:hypothetical protein